MSKGRDEVDVILDSIFRNEFTRVVQRTGRRWSTVLEKVILLLICLMCFFIRLFAVIRYESVIHEFDPYFNFRTTRYLSQEGFYEFWNWFDDGSWYPLGRVIGQTLYPGLMTTSAVFYYILNFFGICINIRNTCVFMAPLFSAFTAVAAYLFTKEVTDGRAEAGLFAALFLGICPSYLSRSVAGSYDNEAVAIFALIFTFYVFVKAINNGSMLWGMFASMAYFYMVASWGGYVFITNTIAIYILSLLLLGRLTERHYVVYSVFYILGTMVCLNIPFVNFQAVTASEHMASHGVFVVTTVYMIALWLRGLLGEGFNTLLRAAVSAAVLGFVLVFTYLTLTGKTRWQGRSMTLLDPTYASKYIPIIASVSEHQPTSWSNYVMDLHILPMLAPVGLYYCFRSKSDGAFFLGIYGLLSVYFSGVMIRLLLVLAPAAACLAAVGASFVVSTFIPFLRNLSSATGEDDTDKVLRNQKEIQGGKSVGDLSFSSSVTSGRTTPSENSGRKDSASLTPRRNSKQRPTISKVAVVILVGILSSWCIKYVSHCTWISSMAYSQPSIVMSQQMRDGSRVIQDDFREAYYWLRMNTHPKAKILSWWDYGYQITVMGNRTVLVDNNTWNNTHIATVGLVLSSKEEEAYPILQRLDVDYVLVLYGGVARYQSDDINKFLWPIRIASGVYPNLVQESEFIGQYGYTVDKHATDRMKNSVMYKLCYYRAKEATRGADLARQQEIGYPDLKPKYFDEVFTSENWIVRIYQVKKPHNRGGDAAGLKTKPRVPIKKAAA